MATLYYVEHVHIAQTRTRITTAYFRMGQESKSESVPELIFGNVNESLPVEEHLIHRYSAQLHSYL